MTGGLLSEYTMLPTLVTHKPPPQKLTNHRVDNVYAVCLEALPLPF